MATWRLHRWDCEPDLTKFADLSKLEPATFICGLTAVSDERNSCYIGITTHDQMTFKYRKDGKYKKVSELPPEIKQNFIRGNWDKIPDLSIKHQMTLSLCCFITDMAGNEIGNFSLPFNEDISLKTSEQLKNELFARCEELKQYAIDHYGLSNFCETEPARL